ncbi:MAG: hypothetical protein JNM36_06955 [Chitinophagales bacterium]|nr:hypothetical protein [Chitinophagales bacterium]
MTKQNTAVIQQSDNDLIFVKIAIFDTKFHFFVPNIPILSLNCQFLNKVRGLKKNFRGVSSEERGLKENFRGVSPREIGLKKNFRGVSPKEIGLKKNFRGVSPKEIGLKKNFRGVSPREIGLKTFLFRQNNDKN